MRRSVVRLISAKELRDLFRDRRTVLLIVGLPAVLYPLFGVVGLTLAKTIVAQKTAIGVVGEEHLPADSSGFPPLLKQGKFAPEFQEGGDAVVLTPVTGDPDAAVRDRSADVVLVVPPDFARSLADGGTPVLKVLSREGDEKSKLASTRLTTALTRWADKLREARFKLKNLPRDFDKVFVLEDPLKNKPQEKIAADEIRDQFAKVFPFILMMWLLAGTIQPAVDLTAGEKERGTMETLLISPASRAEIVAGKFLATTVFAYLTVVWNVAWLTGAAMVLEWHLGFPIISLPGQFACLTLGVPLAMLFSGVCLALGVFARSTKEGQYYLLPLIFVVMPLAFFSMTPGVELGAENLWIPVTGALLLQQKFLSVSGDPVPWGYLPLVVVSHLVWAGCALGFAVWQFQRESVLFRESGHDQGFLARFFSAGGKP